MRYFRYSLFFTLICLVLSAWWGFHLGGYYGIFPALTLTIILGIMELSLSFDNAVVNASVLKKMSAKWRNLFLTVGILIAVFGMRLLFPVVIVAIVTGTGMAEVTWLALQKPEDYAEHLRASHTAISALGGTFLFMVFLSFLMDEGKKVHWIKTIEMRLVKLGKLDSIVAIIAIILLILLHQNLPVGDDVKSTMFFAGMCGLLLYMIVGSIDSLFDQENAFQSLKRQGLSGFIYLEILDASFSFDGVIGAFAITRDIVIIMLGLAIGAMFIRSLTIYLVDKGTLDEYIYLEHGAHYAIGALALIMFYSICHEVPDLFTGTIGIVLIVLSIISSIRYKKDSLT